MKKNLISLCCVFLALLLCAPAVFAEAEPTPEHELNEDDIRAAMSASGIYTMREYDGVDLHFYELRRKDIPQNSPILILLHGTGGRKEEMAGIVKPFADAGYVVVVPDMPGHGESVSDEPLDTIDIIQQAAHNVDIIRSMYENMMYADSENFALLGNSLGALTSMYYAVHSETKPRCVVSYYGTPDWSGLMDYNEYIFYRYRQNGEDVRMTTVEDAKRVRTEMAENSPDRDMEELLSVPLLLVNSDVDDLIPIDGVRNFEENAKAYPNQLTTVLKEGYSHGIIDPTAPEAVAFLQEHMPSVLAQAQP